MKEEIAALGARLQRDAPAPTPNLAPPSNLLAATRTLIDFISITEEFLGRAGGATSEDEMDSLLAALVAALLGLCEASAVKLP